MRFSIFLPELANTERVPVLYYLSGLTCTDENVIQKAGAQRAAAKHGIAFVAPDTSPRGTEIEGEHESYDFGSGAGFYLNATEPLWSTNYRMEQYVVEELPQLIQAEFNVSDAASITGHSMGGHGALITALRNPDKYCSVSAFSPICNPVECPWGQKAFTGYLGEDQASWRQYDATELMRSRGPSTFEDILIDQGAEDNFLTQGQLRPEAFQEACQAAGQNLTLRLQPGYDHSYFFIASFMDDHVNFHAKYLRK
jgi:S-formylglutathione hydrolase